MVIFDKLFDRLRTKRQGKTAFPEFPPDLPSSQCRPTLVRKSARFSGRNATTNDVRVVRPREVMMASVPFDQLDGFIWMNGEFVKWAEDTRVDLVMPINSVALVSAIPHLNERCQVVMRCANAFDHGYRITATCPDRVARVVATTPRHVQDLT